MTTAVDVFEAPTRTGKLGGRKNRRKGGKEGDRLQRIQALVHPRGCQQAGRERHEGKEPHCPLYTKSVRGWGRVGPWRTGRPHGAPGGPEDGGGGVGTKGWRSRAGGNIEGPPSFGRAAPGRTGARWRSRKNKPQVRPASVHGKKSENRPVAWEHWFGCGDDFQATEQVPCYGFIASAAARLAHDGNKAVAARAGIRQVQFPQESGPTHGTGLKTTGVRQTKQVENQPAGHSGVTRRHRGNWAVQRGDTGQFWVVVG